MKPVSRVTRASVAATAARLFARSKLAVRGSSRRSTTAPSRVPWASSCETQLVAFGNLYAGTPIMQAGAVGG